MFLQWEHYSAIGFPKGFCGNESLQSGDASSTLGQEHPEEEKPPTAVSLFENPNVMDE